MGLSHKPDSGFASTDKELNKTRPPILRPCSLAWEMAFHAGRGLWKTRSPTPILHSSSTSPCLSLCGEIPKGALAEGKRGRLLMMERSPTSGAYFLTAYHGEKI